MIRGTWALWLVLCLAAWPALGAPFRFTLLHTNDLHSHVEGTGPDGRFTPETGDHDPVLGHYARLAYAIAGEKRRAAARGESTLLVDAGDFFSGSLFHALGPSPSSPSFPEAELFARAGYDAMTLGNHELDAGEAGLVNLLAKMARLDLTGRLVATNLELAPGNQALESAAGKLPRGIVRELRYHDRALRVGILGLLGVDAARVSAGNRRHLSFAGFDDARTKARLKDLTSRARGEAARLRRDDKADVVVALLHGGAPEDEAVAATEGVDLVVAGHTHQLYDPPHARGNVPIAQAGSFGRYLGALELEYDGHELRRVAGTPTHVRIDDEVPADPVWLRRIAELKTELAPTLARLGYAYDAPVATLSRALRKEPAGNLGAVVTSRLRAEVERRLGSPVDAYMTSLSLIREELVPPAGAPTTYRFSDIFRLLPIGFGPGFTPGSPVVTFHVTKKDLARVLDLVEAYRLVSPNFATVFSDTVHYRVRKLGVPFVNRVIGATLRGKPYREWPPLVHVATNAYVAAFLDKVPAMTYGLFRIVPRDATGAPLASPAAAPVPCEAVLLADALRRDPPG